MNTKSKIAMYVLLCLVLLVAVGLVAHYLLPGANAKPVPSQAQWDAALVQPDQILIGRLISVKSNSIVLLVQQPPLGTTTVAMGSSISVAKTTPLSPAETAAAFEEFKKEQAASGGKPFVPPSSSKTAVLSKTDLKAGDTLLVTLAPESTKDAFAAQKIEVLPPQSSLVPVTTAPMPATPTMPQPDPNHFH